MQRCLIMNTPPSEPKEADPRSTPGQPPSTVNPDPEAHPIHPPIPIQPIHEGRPTKDPVAPGGDAPGYGR